MSQLVRIPRSIWLQHYRQAKKAGNKSRAAARKAQQRLNAETQRALAAKPALRKTPKPPTP